MANKREKVNAKRSPPKRRAPSRAANKSRRPTKTQATNSRHVHQNAIATATKSIFATPRTRDQNKRRRTIKANPVKYPLALLMLPCVWAFMVEAYLFMNSSVTFKETRWFLYGLIGYVVIYPVLYGNNISFLETFEHEIAHLVVYLFNQAQIEKFTAKPGTGKVVAVLDATGLTGLRYVAVSLSPYFLPVFTIPLLVAKPFLTIAIHEFVDVLIGITMGFHYLGLAAEFRLYQTDIQKHTLVFSVVFVLLMNIIFLVVTLCVVIEEYWLILTYLFAAISSTFTLYWTIYRWLNEQWQFIRITYLPYVSLLLAD